MSFSHSSPNSASTIGRPITGAVWLSLMLLAAAVIAYSLWVGPVAFFGDSYLFTDRAKHLFHHGNLNLNNYGGLIYPPLYSIVLAPCYFLKGAAPLTAITVLNSVFVASAILPISLLLRRYAQITGHGNWLCALLITASPTFVSYAPMVLSEAFYIPIVYWTAYAVFRSIEAPSRSWFLASGFLMAVGLLSRTAAASLFLAGFGAWTLQLILNPAGGRARGVLNIIFAAVAFIVPLALWHVIESRWVIYQGHAEYSIGNALHALAGHRADQLIKLEWTANALFYFFTAPLNLGAFLLAALALTNPLAASKDRLLPFAVLLIALAIASIVVLAPTSYGGGPLTWNKYFAPYVGFLTICALRFRFYFTPRILIGATVACAALPFLGRPSVLSCHFPDALTPFINSALPLPLKAGPRDLLFVLLLFFTAPLFLPSAKTSFRWVGAIAATGLALLANGASARFWHEPGLLNFAHYDDLMVPLMAEASSASPTPVFYDPEILRKESTRSLRLLFYYPRLIPQLSVSNLLLPSRPLPDHFFYITSSTLPTAKLIRDEGENLHLYRVDGQLIKHTFVYRLSYGKDVDGQLAIPYDGAQVIVRWLGAKPELTFHVENTVPKAFLAFRLAAAGQARKISATLNGQVLDPEHMVTHVLWTGGFDFVGWNVSLRAGDNTLVLQNDADPLLLPDGGRKVTFLLIDEPVLTQADPSGK